MSFLQRIPLSGAGWAALGILVAVAAVPVVYLNWPQSLCPSAGAVALPSGRDASLCAIQTEVQPATGAEWLIVRVIVPDLSEAAPGTHQDHDAVCAETGLPVALARDPVPARIVVQLMAEAFPRGEPAPGIRQSIEAYSVRDGSCMWELL